jgi:hypothetical protein
MLTSDHATEEPLRLSAAMKGALGDQKAGLVFAHDPEGDGMFYQGHMDGSIADIHAALLDAGIENHSLSPAGNGANVYIADTDGSLAETVGAFATDHGLNFNTPSATPSSSERSTMTEPTPSSAQRPRRLRAGHRVFKICRA